MNYSSQESAERWEKEGIGKDSEFVYCEGHAEPILRAITERVVIKFGLRVNYKIIGPAPHCEEMGDYLRYKLNLVVCYTHRPLYLRPMTVVGFDLVKIRCPENLQIKYIKEIDAKNETEAREKAINWDLDQKEE